MRVTRALELGLPLTRERLTRLWSGGSPRADFACSSLAACVAFCEMPWGHAAVDGPRDWLVLGEQCWLPGTPCATRSLPLMLEGDPSPLMWSVPAF